MLKAFSLFIVLSFLIGCSEVAVNCNPNVTLGPSSKNDPNNDPFKIELDRVQPGFKCKF